MIRNMPTGQIPRHMREIAARRPTFQITEGLNDVSGWRVLGRPVYTLVPPPGYEVDPDTVRAIQAVDPHLTPIWRRQVFLPPYSVRQVLVTHVGLARHVSNTRRRLHLHIQSVPADWAGPLPNELVLMCRRSGTVALRGGGPDEFLPFDGNLVRQVQRDYISDTTDIGRLLDKRSRVAEETRKRLAAAERAEQDYQMKQLAPLMNRLADASSSEYRQYVARSQGTPKARVFLEH